MIRGIHLKILMGGVSYGAVPKEVIEALKSVQITEKDTGQSGFQMVFTVAQHGMIQRELIPSGYFDAPARVILVVVVNGQNHVLMDGVITRHELAMSSDPGASTLTITGLDLSQMMDLIDFSFIPWPAMPAFAKVNVILAKYLVFGVVPTVIPSPLLFVSNVLEKIPTQRGTDLDYVKRLASEVGYVFYVSPGPEPGMSTAYWGPEVKVGEVQPALTVNMDAYSNVDSLNLSFDGIRKTIFTFFYREPNSNINIPIPVPDISTLNPPLGPKLPIPLSYTRLHLAAPHGEDDATTKYDLTTTISRGLARAAQRSDIISGSGTLDVARYGRLLRPRKLVAVRGAGQTYDGHYYVKSVSSSIQPGEFKQSFQLSRNARESWSSEVAI